MTNKEELKEKFKSMCNIRSSMIGLLDANDTNIIVDFFWQEIEQARRARDEDLIQKIEELGNNREQGD